MIAVSTPIAGVLGALLPCHQGLYSQRWQHNMTNTFQVQENAVHGLGQGCCYLLQVLLKWLDNSKTDLFNQVTKSVKPSILDTGTSLAKLGHKGNSESRHPFDIAKISWLLRPAVSAKTSVKIVYRTQAVLSSCRDMVGASHGNRRMPPARESHL